MKTTKKQKGLTIVELLVLVWALFILACVIGGGYVLVHFLNKFW